MVLLVPVRLPVEEQMAQLATAANPATSVPRVINVEKNAAYPKRPLLTSKLLEPCLNTWTKTLSSGFSKINQG